MTKSSNDVLAPNGALMPDDMTGFQIGVIALCVCLAGLDGFDVLAIAYTAPAIAHGWALKPFMLGELFSAGLAGMGVGALLIAPLGDRLGRRPVVLLSLVLLCVFMFASGFTGTLAQLVLMRFCTGLGIGGMLANINVIASEYASAPRRELCVALMSVGYPIGATLGGMAAVLIIHADRWPGVFLFGGLVALVLLPVVYFSLPESLAYLAARQPVHALARINRLRVRLGQDELPALPRLIAAHEAEPRDILAIFRPGALGTTTVAAFLYFSVMATAYFLLSWTPKLLTDLGLSVQGGISGALMINIGGTIGCILYGFYAGRLGVRRLAVAFMLGLCAMTLSFGVLPAQSALLMLAALGLGFCLHTSITVLYVVVPTVFPAAIRATGTGFAMSMGRLGAVFGPLLAGWFMSGGYGRPVYCAALALPMLAAIICLYGLPSLGRPAPVTATEPAE
ncbi:MFS transporter [Acidocella sp.]|uniref:MFS transporter n=1 Tax=Acidocella sp. TaxID=50710 RepID=UPI0026268620|nr:MFS transporter [Acidocella sp.]